jgi:hypothetical protein
MRVHMARPQLRPAEHFRLEEAPVLTPAPTAPYDVPIYATAKVHRDHHIEVAKALYSVPGNLIGTRVDVRADTTAGAGVLPGAVGQGPPPPTPGRPFDRPGRPAVGADHLRHAGPRRLQRLAAGHGPAVGAYAAALLDTPLPWTKMRQVYALLGLVKKWGPDRVNAACERALDAEAINVGLIGRMLERGTENGPMSPSRPAIARHGRDAAVRPRSTATSPSRQRRGGDPMNTTPTVTPELQGPAAPSQARPLPRHPPRTARPRIDQPAWDTPSSSNSSSPTRSPDARTPPLTGAPSTAGLDPTMTLDRWDDTAQITYDRAIWNELCSLRFVDAGHNAVIMGPVGVGKTFLATALGHAAIRRRISVHFERCDRLLKRLRASRLDNSHDHEIRKLLRVDLLIIDDFALQPMDSVDTADVYELIVERHRARHRQ